MAVNDLLMQIKIAVTGDNGAAIRKLDEQLRKLQSTANQLQNVKLAGLTADLANLRSALTASKTLNLGNLPTDMARFKAELLSANTASAGFRSTIRGLNDDSQKIRQLDISPLRNQIQDINQGLALTKLTKLTPLQNSFRAASNDVLATQVKIRDLRETIKSLPKSSPLRAIEKINLKTAITDLNNYKNVVDKSRIAINDETTSLANNTLQKKQQISGLQQQINASNQLILANQKQIVQERANLLAEERKATSAKNNVGLTQAQIKAEQEASRIRQDTIRNTINTKEQEITAARKTIASNNEQILSTKALLAQQKSLNKVSSIAGLGAASSALKDFGKSLGFVFGPQMAGFAAAGTIIGLTDSFINANKQVEQLVRGLNAISGGQGRAEFQYLVDVSNKLGISIGESAHSFLQLEATTAGTAIEGAKTKQIFESFARALNVTGADAVTFNRAFRAVSQSLSKGQLYAEELKGQLAEALPGAIQVFAKAIDVTPKKFLAMVKAGQFAGQTLYDLYGLVAKQLDKTFKVGSEKDFTFVQKANLAKNAFVELSVAIGNTGVWQTFSNLMLDLRDTLKGLESDLPSIVGNLQFLAQTIKELPSPSIDWSAVGAGGSASVSFIPQSLIDLPVNIKAIVQIAVNELALLGNELFKLSNDIGLPVRESFDTIGVYIKTFFQNASNNVMQVVQGMVLGFREVFYVPVLGIIADLQNRLADVNDALASGFDAAGFTDTAKSFSDMANGLRSNSSLMDDVNKKTESLRQEFIRLQTVNQGGYSALLAENLKDLAKEHKAVRDEVQREYEANRAAAQQGIDDSLAENEARKKLRDTQIQVTQELRNQDKLSKRDRGTRNDIIDTREIQQEELEISKRQITAEKKKLDIINAQRDAQVGFAKSQYQQWVESGSISKESADFLSRIAEQGAALKTIKEAQDAIDKYNEKSKSDNSTVTDLYREAALEQIKLAKEEAKKTGNQYKYNQLVEAELKLREEGTKSANEAADLIKQAQLKAKVGDVDKQNVIDVHDAAQKVMDSLKPIPLKTEIAPPTAPALQGDNQAQVYSNDGFILASYSKIQDAYQQTKQVTSQPLRFVVDDAQVNLALQGLNVYQSKIQDIQTRLLPNGQTEIIVTPKINESALQQGFQFIKTAAVQASPTVTVKPVVDATDVAAVKKTSEEVKKDILSILDKDGKKVNFIVVANGVKKTDEEMKRLSAQKEIPVTAFADQSSLDETKKKLDDLGQQIQKGLIGATTISPQGIQNTLDTAFGKDKYKLEIVPTLTGGVTEDGWIKNNEIKRNLIITPVAGATAEADAMIQSQIQGVKSGYEGAWQKLRELDSANQKALEETPLKKLAEIDPTKALEQDAALVSQLSQTVTKYVDVFYRTAGSGEAIAPVTAATGGYLSGYGGGDRIHALLEAGEFILRKEAVRKLGLSNVFALNNLNIPKPSRSVDKMSIPSFSSGGYVGGSNIININVPGSKSIQVSGSRESAMALANLLTRVGRAV